MILGAREAQINSKNKNISTVVKKNAENQPKKTTEKTNILAKKPNLNKDKSVQPNVEQINPSTSASGPNKTIPITSPNKVQQIKVAEKNSIEKHM